MRIIILLTVFVTFISCDDVDKAFKDNEVTPDVISTVPDVLLEVEYAKTGKRVNLGNELAPKDVKDIPEVKYNAEPDSFYTLILTDPDAPSRKNPTRREWNHWLVVNIPGSNISEGETITEYVGSAPPKGSGLHRYVFVLFKQPGKLTFDEPQHSKTDGKRGNFSTEKLRKKYNLGKPLAGNFFQAQFDDSVPAAHKQLGF
ncbi:protein D2 isoform X1 [Anoplophora glabripennis]|uniref:protein D2 isoform X1 n=1 Tax=Anoplophora glabripennis TaxID=217634 RepID=UPI0008749CD6|nr:protein D2 isoform X1 [Anoplophora glabripennis]